MVTFADFGFNNSVFTCRPQNELNRKIDHTSHKAPDDYYHQKSSCLDTRIYPVVIL